MWKRFALNNIKRRVKHNYLFSVGNNNCTNSTSIIWNNNNINDDNNKCNNNLYGRNHCRMYSVDVKKSSIIQDIENGVNGTVSNDFVHNVNINSSSCGINEIVENNHNIISLASSPNSDDNKFRAVDMVMDANSSDVVDVVNEVPDIVIKSMNELSWWPHDRMISMLDFIQLNTGLEWWQTIAVTTIGVRLFIFPIALEGIKRGSKAALARPELTILQEKYNAIKKKQKGTLSQQQMLAQHAEMKVINKKHGASLLGPIVPVLLQMPIFMSFFFALRKLHEYIPGLTEGGFGPYDFGPIHFDVTDMTQVDTSYILPILLTLSFLAVIEVGGEMADKEQQEKTKTVMRFLGLFMFGISTTFPACVTWYWTVNNTYSFCQTSLIQMDLFRSVVGLPLQSEIKEASIRAEKAKVTGSLDAVKAPILQSPIPTVPHHPKGIDESGNAIDDQGNPTFAAVETKETVGEDTTVVNKSTNRKRRSRRRRKRK